MAIQATVIGAFKLSVDGREIDPARFERPIGLRLLKLLLVTPRHRIHREVAAELLWPEADPQRSRANLRKAVHFAREGLAASGIEPAVLAGDATMLGLDPNRATSVDIDRLRDAIDALLAATATGRAAPLAALEQLAVLAGRDILPDDPFAEWLLPLREQLRRHSVDALLAAAGQARSQGAGDLALRLVDRLLQLEPAEEAAHRLAIEIHVEAGRVDAARRQLVACAAALADAYDVPPSPQLQALIDATPRRSPGLHSAATSAHAGLGAVLVDALLEIVVALAGERPLTLQIADVRLTGHARPAPKVWPS